MRCIAKVENEEWAQRFSDFLTLEQIEHQLEQGRDGLWEIWIVDEGQLQRAGCLWQEFSLDPERPEYRDAAKAAKKIHSAKKAEGKTQRSQVVDLRTYQSLRGVSVPGPLTLGLIAVCVIVSVVSGSWRPELEGVLEKLQSLLITTVMPYGRGYEWLPGLVEIREGQLWRLFTPMFVHFGILHLLFNMLWLKDLGGMIEFHLGFKKLLFLVFFISGVSNVVQYFVSGPMFGGMSGVVYGLFGYIWMRGKFDPLSRLHVDRSIVILLIGWYFVCLFGLFPGVANTAHTVGLIMGMVLGFLAAKIK